MIAFTAHDFGLEDVLPLGCVDLIAKPFNLDDLLARVRAYLPESDADASEPA